MRAWIHRLVQRVVQRQRNIIIMDDNYTGNGSNNANGFQIDRYFLDTCSAYNSSHSKQSNAQKRKWKDNNLYIKVTQDGILLIEVYVDDIIFGSTDDRLSQKFAKDMQNEFEMSLLGELSFFLGLQICQRNQGIFISQTKYIREMLKRFGMEDCKPVTTPMQTSCKLRKDDDSKSTE
jgi:hypothetical protein